MADTGALRGVRGGAAGRCGRGGGRPARKQAWVYEAQHAAEEELADEFYHLEPTTSNQKKVGV